MPLSFVYDYVLLPPLIIKNALPCPVKLRIEEELLETKVLENNEEVTQNKQTLVLAREDEKEIYEIRNSFFTKNLQIELSIGDLFAPTVLKINPI